MVLRVASGPRVKLAGRKSALKPPVVYSTNRSKAVVPVLVLLFFCFVVLSVSSSSRCLGWAAVCYCGTPWTFLLLCFALCYFILLFSSPFSISITLLGEERASLGAFRTFIRFALVWFCLFSLPLGVWEVLRFVIVALSGLFFYPLLALYTVLCLTKVTYASKYLLWFLYKNMLSTLLVLDDIFVFHLKRKIERKTISRLLGTYVSDLIQIMTLNAS